MIDKIEELEKVNEKLLKLDLNEKSQGLQAVKILTDLINSLYYVFPKDESHSLLNELNDAKNFIRMQVIQPRENPKMSLEEAKSKSIEQIIYLKEIIKFKNHSNNDDLINSFESEIEEISDRIESINEQLDDSLDSTTYSVLLNKLNEETFRLKTFKQKRMELLKSTANKK